MMGERIAAFDLSGTIRSDGEYITRRGLIFRAGNYPDTNFSLQPDELKRAVASFMPVQNKGAHVPTIFDTQLGSLTAVEANEDGTELYGTVQVPSWLHNLHGADKPLKASLEWDRATKQIVGNALVPNPRIEDSALLTAFAEFSKRHDTNTGQKAMQDIHDTAAKHGATCKAGNAKFASNHEASATQQVHNIAAEHGAKCEAAGGGNHPLFSRDEQQKGQKNMSFKDTLKAWFSAGMPDDFEPGTTQPQKPAGPKPIPSFGTRQQPAQFSQPARPDPAIAQLQGELAKLRQERIEAQAVAFADGEIAAHRAMPYLHDDLVAEFAEAAQDDEKHGIATFSDGTKGNRVDRLRARAAKRSAHGLTRPAAGGDLAVFGSSATTPHAGEQKALSEERRLELMNKTQLGRTIASSQNGQHNRN